MSLWRLSLLVIFTSVLGADTKTEEWRDPSPQPLPSAAAALMDSSAGKVLPGSLGKLLTALGGQTDPRSYSVIHVIRWKDAAAPGAGAKPPNPEPDSQTWYVYNSKHDSDEDVSTRKRVYGSKKVTLVYIHLNRPTTAYDVLYSLATTSKTPAYINHLTGLLALFKSPPPGGSAPPSPPKDVWNYHDFTIPYVPSNLTVTPDLRVAGTLIKGVPAETFDDEGLYNIDFSVAVPLRKISELQYNSTNGVLSPVKASQGNLLALFNYYFKAVDIKGAAFSPYPHFVAGVKIGSQPLKTAVIGLGYGPALANFYFGLLLTTTAAPPGTPCGQAPAVAGGTKLQNRTCPGFGFGLNLGVGAITDALKKKTGG